MDTNFARKSESTYPHFLPRKERVVRASERAVGNHRTAQHLAPVPAVKR
jgi:hypothetical protein